MRKKIINLFLSVLIVVLVNFSADAYTQNNVKIIAETDLGGDSDDQATLVRFLLYANQLDIKGIILSRSNAEFQNDPVAKNPSGASTTLEMAHDYLSAYGRIHNNLVAHDPAYPSEYELKNITVYGHADNGEAGKNHIIKVLKENSGIIWYTNWGSNDGSQSSLDKALDAIQAGEVQGLNYNDVVSRLYYVGVYKQNHIADHRDNLTYYMDTFFPNMDGGRWYHRWNAITNIEDWISNNATSTLCRDYYTGAKESDTQSWTHLIQNGLNSPAKPEWGGWAGRYSYNSSYGILWNDQQDYYNGSRHRDNTLIRWSIPNNATQSEQIQDDFKARILWAQTSSYGKANHHPNAIVNNHNSNEAFVINLEPGSTIQLNASGSSDPDGDNLGFKWDYYKEVSNYDNLNLSSTSENIINISAPSDFTKGKQAHIILHVYDNGTPRLTSYKRIIINSGEQAAQNDYLTISPDNHTVDAKVNQVTTNISSNISWSASSNVTWISPSPESGSQNASLTINIQENTGSDQRNGTITISSSIGNKEITIVQEAPQSQFFSVSPLNHSVGPDASSLTSEINANVSWTASSNADWFSFSPESGSQNASLTINIQENTGSDQRNGTITISSSIGNKEITIVQEAPQSQFFSVSPLNHSVGPDASSLTSEINANVSWTASSNADWFSFSPESGSQNASLTINIQENTGSDQRNGTITISSSIGNKEITIVQEAPQSQFFSVSPLNHSVGPDASSLTSEINANVSWTASSSADWISFSPQSGNESKTLSILADANTTPGNRTGIIVIKTSLGQKEITILQEARKQQNSTTVEIIQPTGYQIAILESGVEYYIDRKYKIVSTPAELDKELLIRTSNNNKDNKSDHYISFKVQNPVDIYVAYDSRATSLPLWLSDWEKQDDYLGVTDEVNYLDLYKKTFPAGEISLSGNKADNAENVKANYVIILKEHLSTDTTVPTEKLKLYPNPLKRGEKINILMPGAEGLVEIYTINGKLILQEYLIDQLELCSSALAKGIYLVKFKGSVNQIYEKLIIQ